MSGDVRDGRHGPGGPDGQGAPSVWGGRPALARIVPFAVYIGFIAVADLLGRLGWSPDQLRWLYGVKIVAVLAALLAYRRQYGELAAGSAPGWRMTALAVLVGVLVLVAWVNLGAGWMTVGSSTGFDPRRDGQIEWAMVAMRIAGAALVVPVMEELFWRSFLMRWVERPAFLQVDPRHVRTVAFVVAMVLFGVEHSLWLAGMVAGAAYAALYMYTRNLWAAIVAHAVTNGWLSVW